MPGSHPQQGVTEGVHITYQWSFADATARASATDPRTGVGYQAADLGKFCRQTDDDSIWMLTASTPTWQNVGGGSGGTLPTAIEGNILVGNATPAWAVLDASTDAQLLLGDGTTLTSVAMSGDVTITNAGVTSIGAAKVTKAMMENLTTGSIYLGTANRPTELDASTNGAVLVGNGTTLTSVTSPLFVDLSSTRVGIGETSPATLLHITSTSATASMNMLTLERTTNVSNTETAIEFQDQTAVTPGQTVGRIYTKREGSATNWGIHIEPNGNGSGGGLVIDSSGNVFIGDTANSFMSQGLTINQGANDNEILAFKSSDVSQPFTSLAAADTYVGMRKLYGAYGALYLQAFTENNSAVSTAMQLQASVGYTTLQTTTTTGTRGAFVLQSYINSGGTQTNPSGNMAIATIQAGTLTRFIFQADGDALADVSWTTFSDDRLKHNQREVTDAEALKFISQVTPKHYTRKSGVVVDGQVTLEKGGKEKFGFIAQELEHILPEAVKRPEDPMNGFYTSDYNPLIAILWAAVKAQQKQIEALEAKL